MRSGFQIALGEPHGECSQPCFLRALAPAVIALVRVEVERLQSAADSTRDKRQALARSAKPAGEFVQSGVALLIEVPTARGSFATIGQDRHGANAIATRDQRGPIDG